jgi:adenine-specific DNA-methyltransferase
MSIEKLELRTPDFTNENVRRVAELFPNCLTEGVDESGKARLTIDFDLLKQELSADIIDGPAERYQLSWPGKRAALREANRPIDKTLRPFRDESVDFDSTHNLFIEGDNLDALKLLQETYLGKVKMIYIDPPYNTGKDFIYRDNFTGDKSRHLAASEQTDIEGGKLVANPETSGRYHSDWLSMMYPRIKLARNLLREDGVMFISIDDNEIVNAQALVREIFNEDQFIATIIWKKRNTPPNDRIIGSQHEYVIAFVKNQATPGLNLRQRSEDQIARYKNPDNHPKGPWVAGDLTANVKGGRFAPTLYYPIINPNTGEEHYPPNNGNWRFNSDRIAKLLANDELYFGQDGKGKPKLKRFLSDVKQGTTWTSLWDFVPFNTSGSQEMAKYFGSATAFENPKPTGFLLELLKAGCDQDGIVLDFFGGSGSIADAVFQLNAEDNGARSVVIVQLPEICPEGSEPKRLGFDTIADISKERIRRAGSNILSEHPELRGKLDVGFRVLKIDSSNLADVSRPAAETTQVDLLDLVENIKSDRSPEDLLFQVLLNWGVDLTLPIDREVMAGKTVYFVAEDALVACFERGINEALVKEIAARAPLRAVFRDDAFKDDSTRINVEQLFKQLSPATELRVI